MILPYYGHYGYAADYMYVPDGYITQNFDDGDKVVTKYRMYPYVGDDRSHDPTSFYLQASYNGTDWINLDYQTNQSFTKGEWNEYEISNETATNIICCTWK